MTKSNKILAVVVAILAVISIALFMGKKNYAVGSAGNGVPTGFDNVNLTGALQIGVTEGNPNVFSPYGVGSLWTSGVIVSSSTLYTQGGSTSGGLCTVSTVAASTTLTLTAANLACSTLSITSGTSTTLTVTLPATSTITSRLLYSGDVERLMIYSASTTAGVIVFSNGTGFTLLSPLTIASTTAATTTLSAGKLAELSIVKLPTTDIEAIFLPAK